MKYWQQALTIAGLSIALTGCMTPAKERQMRDDIFNLQARIMQLEGNVSKQDKNYQSNGENANQRIASTSTALERIDNDMQKIRGDIDALKVGVTTGQMPGTEPEDGSVGKSLKDLSARLDKVEENQKEILAVIEKASSGKSVKETKEPKEETKPKADKPKSFTEIKKAFDKKSYKLVAEEAPDVLESTKKKAQREELLYMLAESLFKVGKMRDAALRYNDFVDMNPAPKKVPQAKLRMGDCFRQLGDKATAKLYYEELVSRFPNAPEAKKAKEMLTKL